VIYTVTLNPSIDHTMRFSRLVAGRLNRAIASRADLGGKGVNVSRALRQLGVATVAMGFAAGMFGRALAEGLRRAGYVCDFVEVEGETRANVTVIDEATGATTKLNEPGPVVTGDDLRAFEERLLGRLSEGDTCIFSGSLPPGAPATTYARLIGAMRAKGVVAVLDTSGDALASGCEACPDWVKPNAVEAAQLVGMPFETPAEVFKGCRAILGLGPRKVLVSLGRRGAALADGQEAWLARAPAIVEASAVGAGDALLAGALWAWGEAMPPQEIVRWAVASGTAAAMERGTAMPAMRSIRQVYERVEVIRLRDGGA